LLSNLGFRQQLVAQLEHGNHTNDPAQIISPEEFKSISPTIEEIEKELSSKL
jgi:hypothetical protein